jgi:hypothetical protein
LPAVANLVSGTLPSRIARDLDAFDIASRRFVEGMLPDAEGLFRFRDYARPYYFVRLAHDTPHEYRPVDLSVGLWLVMRHDPQLVVAHRRDELVLPRFPPLPVLYERWLHFCGALREARLYRGRESVVFSPVGASLARRLCQKLGYSLNT